VLQQQPCVSDSQLITLVLAGDRSAGRQLYDTHAPRVFRLAYRMTCDEEMARECTQDTFVRAFAKLSRFRHEAALGTWIPRIAVTTVLEALRSRRRRAARFTDLDEVRNMAVDHETQDVGLAARLERAVEELPEIYRTALIMHDLEGYTHAAIADVLSIPEGTSKTRVAQARAKLREALATLRIDRAPRDARGDGRGANE
jgi:RNA polymerase sigma-70 factor (ECF subfamily)